MCNQDLVAMKLIQVPYNEMQWVLYRFLSRKNLTWHMLAEHSDTAEFLLSHGWSMIAFGRECKLFLKNNSNHLGIRMMCRAFADHV